MEQMPLISVIVPVYKVEPYLDRCIRSLVGQTYENLEILLVDDGSPDRCGEICDGWAEKDSRIRVLHKKNGGLSDARNAGMAAATGTLIGFVDSDDWVEPDMFQLLHARLTESDSDIAACGIVLDFEDGASSRMLTMAGDAVLDTRESLMALIDNSRLQQPVCNKLYKREQIKDIPFPVGKCHEDNFWTYQAIARAKRVCVFDTPCYHYLQHGGSIMGSKFSLKRLDALEAELEMLAFLRECYPDLANFGVAEAYMLYIGLMQGGLRSLKGTELEILRKKTRNAVLQTGAPKFTREIPLKRRALLLASRISLEGTCRILNFMQDIHPESDSSPKNSSAIPGIFPGASGTGDGDAGRKL